MEKFPKYKYAAVARVFYDTFITEGTIRSRVGGLKNALQSTIYKRAAAVDGFSIANYDRGQFEPPVGNFIEVIIWFD